MYAHRVKPRQKTSDTIFEALGHRKFAIFARVPRGIFGLLARIEFVRFVHCGGGDIVRPSPNVDLIICVYIYICVCVYQHHGCEQSCGTRHKHTKCSVSHTNVACNTQI